MFDLEYTDGPLFSGFYFTNSGTGSVDTFLNFDRSGSTPSRRATDASISSSSKMITSATANFTNADVGTVAWITYPDFFLKTTIDSVTNSNTAVLHDQPLITQSNVMIHTGTGYGIGIHVGNSQNSMQHIFSDVGYYGCDAAIKIENGGAQITHLNGGFSNYGIYIANLVQNSSIGYYESENDAQGIYISGVNVGPVIISNSRLSNSSQFANGFFVLGGRATLMSSLLDFIPPSDAVLIGRSGGSQILTSISNEWNALSISQVGYDRFINKPVTWINDNFDTTTASPISFGCFDNNRAHVPSNCVSINYQVGRAGPGNLHRTISGVSA